MRRYRASRAHDLPLRIRLPFMRNLIRREAIESWSGGYVLTEAGYLLYIPAPLDQSGGYMLLKPHVHIRILDALCKPGDVFVDVGANIGHWMVAAAKAVGPAGKVLSFEPIPKMAEALRKTASANRLSQVGIFQMALAEAPGTRDFSIEKQNSGGSRLGAMHDDAGRSFERISVAVRTLDEIVAEQQLHRLDVLKVDVEGFEYAVLAGAEQALRRFKPAVFMETGYEPAEQRAALCELLARTGYRLVGVGVGEILHEATLEDYRLRRGIFAELPSCDMLLMGQV